MRVRLATLAVLCLFLLALVVPARAQQVSLKPGTATVHNDNGDDEKDDDDKEISFTDEHIPGDPRNVQAPPFGDRLDLTTPWLFLPGNGPDFASPTFNDTSWKPVDPRGPQYKHLLSKLNEIWYRVHVKLVPGTHDLALTIADFGGSYRAYVNGKEIGGHGIMSGRGDYLLARSATYAIPDSALAPDTVIAIHAFVGRVDRATYTFQDGLSKRSAVYLGPANLLYRDQQTYFANGSRKTSARSRCGRCCWRWPPACPC